VTPSSKKLTAVFLLALLALPTGMCSLFFTSAGLVSVIGKDTVERAFGIAALICSGVGWVVCGLTIWGARRMIRTANLEHPSNISS
jgi:hypothetical protein